MVSYYAKGRRPSPWICTSVAALTLDTVMTLWAYGAQGIGVPEAGVGLTWAIGLDLKAWFDTAIRGTASLPLESAIEHIGVLLHSRPAQSSSDLGGSSASGSSFTKGSLGATFDRAAAGVKVKTIINGSAAERMGLSAKDLIVAVNHLQVNKGNIDKMLGALGEGTDVTIHAFRRDELKVFTGPLDAPQKVFYLIANKEASENQLVQRQLWLAELIKGAPMITLWFLLSQALAHPFSQEEYSLRTAVRVSEKGVVPLVALEIPIPIALREIGAKTDDPRAVKKRKIKRYNQQQWDNLAESLVFTIDGVPAKGKWRAIDHPANGKASEGFFVYLVSFQFKSPATLNPGSKSSSTIKATPTKMVYSVQPPPPHLEKSCPAPLLRCSPKMLILSSQIQSAGAQTSA